MLKKFKQATLKSLKTTGMSSLVKGSRWRRQRLLILAYHGISLADEHLWNGSQFISAEVLRSRLELLEERLRWVSFSTFEGSERPLRARTTCRATR